MDEYIVELSYDPVYDCIDSQDIVKEPIVRCRDCKLCVVKGYRLYCDLNAGGFPEVESDGFCAWGERREE